MANSLLVNPVKIDTFMSTSFKAQTLTSLGSFQTLRVEKVYWENPANIGDIVTIVDPISGSALLPLRCEVAGQSQVVDWTPKPHLWSDFEVSQITSGTLYIWLA
jgi:hypothetical protein